MEAGACFWKLLRPSHPWQPWPNCSPPTLVSFRADRRRSSPRQSLFLCFWRWGWGLGDYKFFAGFGIISTWFLLRNVLWKGAFSIWLLFWHPSSCFILRWSVHFIQSTSQVYLEGVGSVDSLPGPRREGVDSRFVERMTIWINKRPASFQVCPADQLLLCY